MLGSYRDATFLLRNEYPTNTWSWYYLAGNETEQFLPNPRRLYRWKDGSEYLTEMVVYFEVTLGFVLAIVTKDRVKGFVLCCDNTGVNEVYDKNVRENERNGSLAK